jgi:hypothetical protein
MHACQYTINALIVGLRMQSTAHAERRMPDPTAMRLTAIDQLMSAQCDNKCNVKARNPLISSRTLSPGTTASAASDNNTHN